MFSSYHFYPSITRGDMSKPDSFYNTPPMRRTTDELREFANKKTGENYCCCHEPLLNIPLDHIIPDELHLMLRVTDILLENLIEDAMQWDDKESSLSGGKKNLAEKSRHVKNLVKSINSCGVTFHLWEKKNADGKGSGTWDWTSLMGDDRKKLLRELPLKLVIPTDCIQPETCEKVAQLWKVKINICQKKEQTICNTGIYVTIMFPNPDNTRSYQYKIYHLMYIYSNRILLICTLISYLHGSHIPQMSTGER